AGVRGGGLGDAVGAGGGAAAGAGAPGAGGAPGGAAGRPPGPGGGRGAGPLEARRWRGSRAGGVSLVCSGQPFEPGPLGRHKTTSRLAYHLAREEARAARADEAVLVSPAGLLLEGAVSNLFLIERGTVFTPPLTLGILPGITRAIVLGLCIRLGIPVEERPLTIADLTRAEGIFLTNSVQEVAPVRTVDGVGVAEHPIA